MTSHNASQTPRWMQRVLIAAGGYNLAWGAVAILFPNLPFDLLGMERPNYPQLWQCIGMIVGVYGIGYVIASWDPARHWPVVLVGFLGKIFGPIGFAKALISGDLPLRFGGILLTNDFVWWIPFATILHWVYMTKLADFNRRASESAMPMHEALANAVTQSGSSLLHMSMESPILVTFLRHFGCTFCREAIADLAKDREKIEASGVKLAFVHMSDEATAGPIFAAYGLGDVPRVADPQQAIYRAFGLARGSVGQLFGLQTFVRGWQAAINERHGFGTMVGDVLQMPGVFVLRNGKVTSCVRHKVASDRPDYAAIAQLANDA